MKKCTCLIILILLICFETSVTQAANLVVNGDFEAGNTGFITGYTYTDEQPNGLDPEGYYAIGTDPCKYHVNTPSYRDHTSGIGNMMIVNGATSPNVTVWQQTVSVSPNTTYEFSLWLSNWSTTPDLPLAHLEYFVNDISIGSSFEPNSNEAGKWVKVSKLWQSATHTTATIMIVDIETAISTNDFVIDDISLEQMLLVKTPDGGESWIAGTTQKIQWETIPGANITTVKIEYSTNNGLAWNDVNTVPNTGSYNWLVPQVTSNQCLVRISDAADANVFDVSDNTFIIYQCRLNSKADLDGNCKVDMTDLALFANDWLRNGNPFDPENTEPLPIIWVYIDDPGVSGHEGFTGYMSKYETTNAQYCQFLNAALASGDITVDANDVLGANGSNSGEDFVGQVYYRLDGPGSTCNGATNGGAARINYSGGVFGVDSGFENYPVTYVSWYGAAAFCNYYGFRLPTEWEWQAVADYDGSYTYGCGTSINNSIANCYNSTHPNGTTIVGDFGTYGYGMCDMAGNVWDWTSSIYSSYRVIRGGSWGNGDDYYCAVSYMGYYYPYNSNHDLGFRVCR